MADSKSTTVAAIATVVGRGALAVLRVSGSGAFSICGACIVEKEKFAGRGPWRVGVYTLCDPETGEAIDRVTAVKYSSPRSYTGEDMVEITTHGGAVIPRRVLDALLRAGAEPAGPGEFTRRAVLAGKMDILGAEAIDALVGASEEESSRVFSAASGGQSAALREVESELESVLCELEGGIEADAEVGGEQMVRLHGRVGAVRGRLWAELEIWERSRRGEPALEVVIAGLANAGKSTLFNLLLGEDRALVDDEPGTTRDYVSGTVRFGPVKVELVDTAGLDGTVRDGVVAQGIAAGWEKIRRAVGILWVCPMDRANICAEERRLLDAVRGRVIAAVLSKRDREVVGEREGFALGLGVKVVGGNLMCDDDRARVRDEIAGEIHRFSEVRGIGGLVVSERQAAGVRRVVAALDGCLGEGCEFVADGVCECVGRALSEVRGIRGCGGSEILDSVLGRFCIGK